MLVHLLVCSCADELAQALGGAGYKVMLHDDLDRGITSILHEPGCVIVEGLQDGRPSAIMSRLRIDASHAPVIFISDIASIYFVVATMKLGAHDVLQKPVDSDRLLRSVNSAANVIDQYRRAERESKRVMRNFAKLTQRQREVMDLAVKGMTNREIGSLLGISKRTVDIYRARVMDRMGASHFSDLVRMSLMIKRMSTASEPAQPVPEGGVDD